MSDAVIVATDLVAAVSRLLQVTLDFTLEIKKKDMEPILAAIRPKINALIALKAENDIEACINLYIRATKYLKEPEKVLTELKNLSEIVKENKTDNPLLRLRILTNIFNSSVSYAELRYETLLHVIEYAGNTDNLSLISKQLDSVDSMVDSQLIASRDHRRRLNLAIANVLDTKEDKKVRVLIFLEKYLQTFPKDQELKSAREHAVRAIRLFLKNTIPSFISGIDLTSLPAIQALETDPEHGKLYQLFQIFASQGWKEYDSFSSTEDKTFFEPNGLSKTMCEATIRLVTLCSLQPGFAEIPFAIIADKLGVHDDQVEEWVVKAITSNLITAKIDQVRCTVIILKTQRHGFAPQQWKDLQTTLRLYKKNVGSLIEMAQNARKASLHVSSAH
uniref:Carbohydratebinding protein putative n=1 Tax=Albugo laibachii Nc14 TaxID=890382 RepID=F0W8X3_9STRA|nr:carbohydratebinding protein putative [Albugo laibachii Nc14]|eukprot:CCA17584.1 carbohydratebinding protein putative [Albugo laibachii Nc14]